jgi:hypothetical protein
MKLKRNIFYKIFPKHNMEALLALATISSDYSNTFRQYFLIKFFLLVDGFWSRERSLLKAKALELSAVNPKKGFFVNFSRIYRHMPFIAN